MGGGEEGFCEGGGGRGGGVVGGTVCEMEVGVGCGEIGVKSGVCKQGRSTTSSVSQYALQDGPGTVVLTVGMYKTDGKGAPSNKQPLTSLTLSCRSPENIFNSKGWASHSRPSAFHFAGGIDLWARHLHPGGARPSFVGGTHRVGTQIASPHPQLAS